MYANKKHTHIATIFKLNCTKSIVSKLESNMFIAARGIRPRPRFTNVSRSIVSAEGLSITQLRFISHLSNKLETLFKFLFKVKLRYNPATLTSIFATVPKRSNGQVCKTSDSRVRIPPVAHIVKSASQI